MGTIFGKLVISGWKEWVTNIAKKYKPEPRVEPVGIATYFIHTQKTIRNRNTLQTFKQFVIRYFYSY